MVSFIMTKQEWHVKALEFAKEKVATGSAFRRNNEATPEIQIDRWYRGKLAEQAVCELLRSLDIPFECLNMFKVVSDPFYRDGYDIMLHPSFERWAIDVKPINPNGELLVHSDHLKPRIDCYVGYELTSARDVVAIFGYVWRQQLEQFSKLNPRPDNYYWFKKEELHPVTNLQKKTHEPIPQNLEM